MSSTLCACCGKPFEPRPQVPNQTFCSSPDCQRARKLRWQQDKLRADPRVIVYEQLSARLLTTQHVPEMLDLIVCDASFISLAKVLEVPLRFAKDDARLVALIKPQFEADRNEIGKKGVVKDPTVQERVCHQIKSWLIDKGWSVIDVIPSPITGPEGNVEFLIAATRNAR